MPKLKTIRVICPISNKETEFEVFDDNKILLECACCNVLMEVENGVAKRFEGKLNWNSDKVIYEGTKESVEKLMNLVGYQSGINNTNADGTGLYLHGKFFKVGSEITKIGELCVINGEVFDKTGFLNINQ